MQPRSPNSFTAGRSGVRGRDGDTLWLEALSPSDTARMIDELIPAMEPRPPRQARKQMREVFARNPQEPLVRRDPHHRLRNTRRDDLRVVQQQVEVGEHRGPLGSTARIGTADFDLTAAGPYNTAKAVELLI